MNNDVLRLSTDEQRQWLALAKERGGICAACGRPLDDGEPVYIEPVDVEIKRFTPLDAMRPQNTSRRDAVLGRECSSPTFVERAEKATAEVCEGCGRPGVYAVERAGRTHTLCSRRCGNQVKAMDQKAAR